MILQNISRRVCGRVQINITTLYWPFCHIKLLKYSWYENHLAEQLYLDGQKLWNCFIGQAF